MRILKKSFEIQTVCPNCGAILFYTNTDVHLSGDMEGEYIECIKCPECSYNINVH